MVDSTFPCQTVSTVDGKGSPAEIQQTETTRRSHMFKHIILAMVLALGIANAAIAAEPVDVNTATAEQLAEALNGVGESKARAIVEYRESNGLFTHIDELINVRGIGMATVDKNRDMLRVESTRPGE